MKVYVAGSSRDTLNVRHVQSMVRASGHSITYDWVPDVERYGPGVPADGVAQKCASRDRDGVLIADTIIVVPHPRLWGGLVEVGMALGHCKPVWVINEWYHMRYSVFWELRDVYEIDRLDTLRRWLDSRAVDVKTEGCPDCGRRHPCAACH